MVRNILIGKLAVAFITILLLPVFINLAEAADDEMPAQNRSNIYYQTLEGMPLPGRIPAVGTLKGIVQRSDGKPLAGGEVYFFNDAKGPPPVPEKYWRVPDETASLDTGGGFTVELPPGKYFIGAIQRKADQSMVGPPSNGDIYYAGSNRYEVLPASEKNLGVIRGAIPFYKKNLAKRKGVTAIEGSVCDVSGKTVENVMVFAYKESTMNDKPLYVSERTGRDGTFSLRVGGAGSYFLRIRDSYGGGAPKDGAFMGAYGGINPIAVTVKAGEILTGLKLIGEKFVRPTPGSNEQ